MFSCLTSTLIYILSLPVRIYSSFICGLHQVNDIDDLDLLNLIYCLSSSSNTVEDSVKWEQRACLLHCSNCSRYLFLKFPIALTNHCANFQNWSYISCSRIFYVYAYFYDSFCSHSDCSSLVTLDSLLFTSDVPLREEENKLRSTFLMRKITWTDWHGISWTGEWINATSQAERGAKKICNLLIYSF